MPELISLMDMIIDSNVLSAAIPPKELTVARMRIS